MFAVLLQVAFAAPIPADTLDDVLLEVREKHQAPFLVGGTWDTMKAVEKVIAETGVPADPKRVADDLSLASTFLIEQVNGGAYQCALYVGKSAAGMYSLHRFGDCENPPTASSLAPVASKGALTPDPARTAPMYVAAVGGTLEGVDTAAARARLQSALASRKWPTADPARYAATATVEQLVCAGEKPACDARVSWSVSDGARKAVVYQVVTRGQATAPTAAEASLAALENALVSLLSRPLLVSRLDPAPPVAGDPAPDWAGDLPLRACPAPAGPLPDAEADLRARLGTATQGERTGPAVLLSPDGWALVPSVLAGQPVEIAVGERVEKATAVRTDHSLGLAVVKLPGDDWPCLGVGAAAPSAGAKLYAPLPDKLGLATIVGVQAAGSFKFLKTNLAGLPTGTPMLDATGALRAVASSVVSIGGMAGTPFGLPAPTLVDRLDLAFGPASEPDPASRAGVRGIAAVVPTIDADDPAP